MAFKDYKQLKLNTIASEILAFWETEKIFEKSEDDYNGIMIKAITDRLAEAFAEYMHDRVRKDLWGYQPKELSTEDMIQEKYQETYK